MTRSDLYRIRRHLMTCKAAQRTLGGLPLDELIQAVDLALELDHIRQCQIETVEARPEPPTIGVTLFRCDHTINGDLQCEKRIWHKGLHVAGGVRWGAFPWDKVQSRCFSIHSNQQCEKPLGHTGHHQEGMEVWGHA